MDAHSHFTREKISSWAISTIKYKISIVTVKFRRKKIKHQKPYCCLFKPFVRPLGQFPKKFSNTSLRSSLFQAPWISSPFCKTNSLSGTGELLSCWTQICHAFVNCVDTDHLASEDANYRIQSNYRTNPYKRSLMKFPSLQITASVLFIYFFIKAYVVGSHLNCIDLSMQFK